MRDVLVKSALSFEKKDVAMATKVWVNDESLTVFESGHPNYGWADYRDAHLVPEMAEMKNTKYALTDLKIHIAGDGIVVTGAISASLLPQVRQNLRSSGKSRLHC